MKVLCTIGKTDGEFMGFTPNKEYNVIRLIKSVFSGNTIHSYKVIDDRGNDSWLFPEEAHIPLKIKKNPPWRKILRSMGYQRRTSLNSNSFAHWINPTNGMLLVESILPSSNIVEYIKDMESYCAVLDNYYMEMESIWTEGEII